MKSHGYIIFPSESNNGLTFNNKKSSSVYVYNKTKSGWILDPDWYLFVLCVHANNAYWTL